MLIVKSSLPLMIFNAGELVTVIVTDFTLTEAETLVSEYSLFKIAYALTSV